MKQGRRTELAEREVLQPSVLRRSSSVVWLRTPLGIVLCGCLISMIGFGPRSALGFFLTPMSAENGWGREVFALSVAMQTLIYGAAQPFSGAIADRFGTTRVIVAGTLLYAAGIYMMAHAGSPGMLYLSSGVLIGFGLSGCSFNLVISSFGKLLPESWRSLAFGAGTAAGSFGQFLFSPLAVSLIDGFGWRTTLEIFAGLLLLIVPLAVAIATPRSDAPDAPGAPPSAAQAQTYKQALAEAFGHRSYILLVLGFFTCGFQLGFVTLHLPAYLIDRGLSAQVGGWTLGVIGLFNIAGALLSGWLGGHMPKRYILSFIYFARAGGGVSDHAAGEPGGGAHLRRRDRPALAVERASHVGPRARDVRHPLARHAIRRRVLQPPGRRFPRHLFRRAAL
jgi:MFS family permease